MNDNNDKWLDEIISKTINTGKPQFDAEKFKQKFPDEMRILQSRASQQHRSVFWKSIFNDPISSLATAAVLILMVGIFVFFSAPKDNTTPPKVLEVTHTPAEMMSLLSINLAYNRGGFEEIEKQYEEVIKEKKMQPKQLTIQELLADLNGA